MFWGLVLQPGKKYSSTVKESFHLSAVAVDTRSVSKNEAGVFPVQVEVNGQELIICNLSNQCLHVSVDLYFDKGTELTFMTTGKASIHLTGYTAPEEDSENEFSDDEGSDSSDNEDLEKSIESYKKDMKLGKKDKSKKDSPEKRKLSAPDIVAVKKSKLADPESSGEEESSGDEFDNSDLGDFSFSDDNDENDDDDEDQDDSSDDEEEEDSEESDDDDTASAKKKNKKQPQQLQQTPKSKKEQPVSNKKQDKTPGSSKKPEKLNKSDLANGVPTKAEKKAQKKSLSKAEVKTPKGNESASNSSPSPKKQSMEGGVMVEELKQGNGPVAKPGKMVAVYYTGRLKNNNRVFDQSNAGPGFKFRLGRGEVIKAWDTGLNGMKVGSKRRITCPPSMAYGAKGSPPSIPPNSTLIFDVELRSVN